MSMFWGMPSNDAGTRSWSKGDVPDQSGRPKLVESSAQSHDEELQRRLWAVAEGLTGVSLPV